METIAKGLLSSDERIRLLKKILNMTERNLRVRELAREVGVSAGFVSKYMGKLKESVIIGGGKVSLVNPKVSVLRMFLNINEVIDEDVVGVIRNHIKGIN